MRIRTGLIVLPAVFVLGLVAQSAQAQTQLSLLGGINIASLRFNPSVEEVFVDEIGLDTGGSKGIIGVAAGVGVGMPLTGRLGLQIDAFVTEIGTKLEGSISDGFLAAAGRSGIRPAGIGSVSFEQTIRRWALDVKANVAIPLGSETAAMRARVLAGLFFEFYLNQSEKIVESINGDEDETDVPEDEQTDIKDNNVGVNLGFELWPTEKLAFLALYQLGLVNIDNSSDEADALFSSVKVSRFIVGIRWLFR